MFVDCPLEALIERDPKGLYKTALAGELKNLAGISDLYERPVDPEIVVRTDLETPAESASQIIRWLENQALIS